MNSLESAMSGQLIKPDSAALSIIANLGLMMIPDMGWWENLKENPAFDNRKKTSFL